MFWFVYDALVFTAAIFAGIIVFRVSFEVFRVMTGTCRARGQGLTQGSGQTQRCITRRPDSCRLRLLEWYGAESRCQVDDAEAGLSSVIGARPGGGKDERWCACRARRTL